MYTKTMFSNAQSLDIKIYYSRLKIAVLNTSLAYVSFERCFYFSKKIYNNIQTVLINRIRAR